MDLLRPPRMLTSGVALTDLVRVGRQLPQRVVESLLGVGGALVLHPLVVACRCYAAVLRVEVALEELLVLLVHVQGDLPRPLPLRRTDEVSVLDLEPHLLLLSLPVSGCS